MRTMEMLGLKDEIEDILITLSSQYHLIRLLRAAAATGCSSTSRWTRSRANLAMARHQLRRIEEDLEV